jgi:hypothetical protein
MPSRKRQDLTYFADKPEQHIKIRLAVALNEMIPGMTDASQLAGYLSSDVQAAMERLQAAFDAANESLMS